MTGAATADTARAFTSQATLAALWFATASLQFGGARAHLRGQVGRMVDEPLGVLHVRAVRAAHLRPGAPAGPGFDFVLAPHLQRATNSRWALVR